MTTPTAITIQVRPQPLGIFPFPAGLLLLPPTAGNVQAALDRLLRGDASDLPHEWRFFGLAVSGDIEGARAAITGDDAISLHNRAALGEDVPVDGKEGDFAELRQAVLYAAGRRDTPPSPRDLDGELRAFVWMLHAARSIEDGNPAEAVEILKRAVAAANPASPEFAAQLLGQLAALEAGRPARAIQHYREAVAMATGPAKAELALQLGVALQDAAQGNRRALVEAVHAYQDALRFGISVERNPESFALLQNNLALVYLAMPATEAGDQLRMGIAIQCLREALKVYTKEAYPEQWASAQLNLANALQYLPTSHPEENLIRAVEIYEEILGVRHKAFDPVGYARLLANQANALAHLGIFSPAMEKISEAHKLFQWHNEPEMAASAMTLVENISRQRSRANGSL